MYQLVAEIFPWVVAIYLLDCLTYIRSHQWLVFAFWPGARRLRGGPDLHLTTLLPTSEGILLDAPPVYFSEEGVWIADVPALRVPDPSSLRLVRFDARATCHTEERRVLFAGRTLIHAPSSSSAQAVARLIDGLNRLPVEQRTAHLRDAIAAAHDLAAIDRLQACHLRWGRRLVLLGSLVWVGAFVVLPISLYTNAPHRPDPVVVTGVLAVGYGLAIDAALRALRSAGLGTRRALATLLPLFFFPGSSCHVWALVSREAYAGFDPLAAASRLLPTQCFQQFARRQLRWLQRSRERAAGHALEGYWQMREDAALALLGRIGIARENLLAAPIATDSAAALYCPLCGTEYRAGFSRCADCEETLEALATAVDPVDLTAPLRDSTIAS